MRSLALVIGSCFLSIVALGQQYPFLKWSTPDGLAQSQVRCIEQDHIGYLWIGTLGGVSRFNGRTFKNFSRRDGLLSNQINSICELGDSLMVFGSIGGITLFNGNTFTPIRFPVSFESAQINALLPQNDALLIATENGLLRWRDSLEVIYGPSLQSAMHIKRLVPLENGQLAIVTRNELLRVAHPGGQPDTLVHRDQIGTIVMDGCRDLDSGWLLATVGKGLIHITDEGIRSYSVSDGLISENITGITADRENKQFWMRSRDGFSKARQKNKRWEFDSIDERSGLDVTDVRSLFIDRECNIWLGTYGGGLRKFIHSGVTHFSSQNGLSGDIVMTILQDHQGAFWFGTYDNGITRTLEKGGFEHYGMRDGLKSTRVWSSTADLNGGVWFGTSGGLSRFADGRFETFTTADGLPHNQVLSLMAEENTLVIGTARGLATLDLGSNTIEQIAATKDLRIRAIVKGGAHEYWMATSTGVAHLIYDRLTVFNEKSGLPDNSVYCLQKAPNGDLWAGTESGLGLINAHHGTVQAHFIEGGFGANHINFIAFDNEARCWLGTNDGLYIGGLEPQEWERFGKHHGITFLETNQNAIHLRDSVVWFGSSGALVRLDRRMLSQTNDRSQIQVHIDEIRINLLETDFSKYGTPRTAYGSLPEQLVVPHTDNHFSFTLDALSLRNPENIQFQYRLDGVDDEWEPVTSGQFTSYAQLKFGRYTFEVRALDSRQQASEILGFSFSIQPPFWLRWWFVMLEIILALGLVLGAWRLRQRAFLKNIEREQLVLKSRMLTLEQKSLNSSMNRHFIFNSLNAIQYYINRQDRLSANRYLSSFAKLIRKNLDSSQTNFATLDEEIERLKLYLQLEQMRFTDRFEYTIHVDEQLDGHRIKLPSMLLQPFLENSIWHGLLPKEGIGKVNVHITPTNDQHMCIRVEDNGIGINTSLRNKEGDDQHISRGMEITSSRLELLRKATGKTMHIVGPVELTNESGSILGTRVDVILPTDLEEDSPTKS